MGRLLILAVCGLFCVGAAPSASHEARLEQKARSAVEEFMQTLKGHLSAAIEEGGPAHAINVCSEVAPGIASRISREQGWEVGRTSLRLRNTRNLPEPWERGVLESFEGRRSAGADVKGLEYGEMVEVDGRKRFRFMKAIPTQALCLQCHGKNLSPAVKEELARHYPHDRATGFAEGDIRGAFTIEIPFAYAKEDTGS